MTADIRKSATVEGVYERWKSHAGITTGFDNVCGSGRERLLDPLLSARGFRYMMHCFSMTDGPESFEMVLSSHTKRDSAPAELRFRSTRSTEIA